MPVSVHVNLGMTCLYVFSVPNQMKWNPEAPGDRRPPPTQLFPHFNHPFHATVKKIR